MLETGLLSPRERYRALIEEMRHHTDLVEMADRKSRFALVILTTLSGVNFVCIASPDLLSGGVSQSGPALAVYVTFYAAASLYLCAQAIGTLKPRLFVPDPDLRDDDGSVGKPSADLLSIKSISRQNIGSYYEVWRKAQFRQLNMEVAQRIQLTARIIILKYRALERLYSGLLMLVFLTGFLIVGLTFLRLTG